MYVKICDRCGKVCEKKDSQRLWIESDYYFDPCTACRLWLLHELHKKEEWEEKTNE